MNEHEKEARTESGTQELHVLGAAEAPRPTRRPGLVVDLSGIEQLDLTSLALLLTAQQNAQEQGREVWLAGVPLEVWQSLHIMGLGRFFRPFPVSGEVSD